MSNFRSIGAVTATLRAMMQQVVNAAAPGATVTTKRPEARGEAQKDLPGLNIFLYRTNPNPAFRNHDSPTRDQQGRLIARPTSGIDLDYLFTFYGPGLTPQALLGRSITSLHAEPYLTPARIQSALKNVGSLDDQRILDGADLAEQVERLRIEPIPLELEELSKLWSVFLQVPYDLSVAYRVSVVLLSADLTPQAPLPVRGGGVGSSPGAPSQLEQVVPSQFDPSRDQLVVLRGRNLIGTNTRIQFGSFEPVSPKQLTPAGEMEVEVPVTLPFGVHSVRVWKDFNTPHGDRPISSNEIPIVIRPALVDPIHVNLDANGVKLALTFQRPIESGQVGTVLLNPLEPNTADACSFDFRVDQASRQVDVVLPNCPAQGDYLVRVRINGADSQLTFDETLDRYAGPRVSIP